MQWLAIYVLLLDFGNRFLFNITCSASEFSKQGDYLLGGFFSLNYVYPIERQTYPVSMECNRFQFDKSAYQMFQMMRFAVEEITNSSTLLPNVSLGYEIFNRCSDTQNFPSVLSLISQNGTVPVLRNSNKYQPKILAVTGPHESTRTKTVSPFFMTDLIPMVNYGSSSYELSDKMLYPSFLRTVPNNKELIDIIISIIRWFRWNWVAFIGSQDNYSQDGLGFFSKYIRNFNICLAYQESLTPESNYSLTLQKIEKHNIKIIVVFSTVEVAKKLIQAAIKNNIRNKVWIAGEGWSVNSELLYEPEIQTIGNIFGITEKETHFNGFRQFIYNSRRNQNDKTNQPSQSARQLCNQDCDNCTYLNSTKIIIENPMFFPIYASIYTIAHALHKVLQCDENTCNKSIPVYPYKLLKEMKTLNFSLNGRQVNYDENGDPLVYYDVVFWSFKSNPRVFERIGLYNTYPKNFFTINSSCIGWDNDTSVPFANCSVECLDGYRRIRDKNHACCYQCQMCPRDTYINSTENPYTCVSCNTDEWSDEKSTECLKRSIMYLEQSDPLSIILMISTLCLIVSCIAIIILFSYNYNTPVVKSAGGNMCFLMLASLAMSSTGVFFFFEQPTVIKCIFRYAMFIFFYTICLSCMTVRSFQIVCVFKMAAKFPSLHRLWVQYNGQWLVIAVFSLLQIIVFVSWLTIKTPDVSTNRNFYKYAIILGCSSGHLLSAEISAFIVWSLSVLCFFFSYMGTDLPKNYNEAKSLTFSILLFYISWALYLTANLVSEDPYIQLLNAVAQQSSLYGILLSYFIPKSYVIVFQPKKNTQAYFQTSIQNYTQTISRM